MINTIKPQNTNQKKKQNKNTTLILYILFYIQPKQNSKIKKQNGAFSSEKETYFQNPPSPP